MATPEGRVKAKVKVVLKAYRVYFHCPVQNGLGAPSLDFIGCHRGRYFAIETKAPGKKLTDRQKITAAEILASGGKLFVIDGTPKTDTYDDLEDWIIFIGDCDYAKSKNIKEVQDDPPTVVGEDW